MREILGRRREGESPLLDAALLSATRWEWPVLPGATLSRPALSPSPRLSKRLSTARLAPTDVSCGCLAPDCPVPGAHPLDPVLLAATTDARMVRWWWTGRPTASVLLATGRRAPCALSLPAVAGARALAEFDRSGVRVGPVAATPTRATFLVRPYELEVLGELLCAHDWVPSSLRFHGEGGYVVLPPSRTGPGQVRWERPPEPATEHAADTAATDQGSDSATEDSATEHGADTAATATVYAEGGTGGSGADERAEPAARHEVPWLPRVERLLDVLVEASAAAPDTGSSLAY